MNSKIDRPDIFFREIHPVSTKGRVILERSISRSKLHSMASPEQAEKIARLSYKVPDVFYSSASFTGMPLLTNFENTKCLYVSFWYSPYVKLQVYGALKNKGFPYPTAVVTDGEKLTFFWILEKVITQSEFHKLFLLQQSLYQMLHEFKPCKESLSISSLIRLIGSINSKVNGFVRLINYSESKLNNSSAERLLLKYFPNGDSELLRKHSRAILELLALMGHRFMTWSVNSVCEDWLVFFGASLCHFCTKEQLVKELQAIAVSLEGKKWSVIKGNYGDLIQAIADMEIRGRIIYRGQTIYLDRPDWFNLVCGKLRVAKGEIIKLGLNVIVYDEYDGTNTVINTSAIQPVGETEFIPVERLMFQSVA